MNIVMIQPPHYRLMGSQNRRIFPAFNNVANILARNGHGVVVYNMDLEPSVGELYGTWKVIIGESGNFFTRVAQSSFYEGLVEFINDFNPDTVIITAGDCAIPTVDLGTFTAACEVAKRVRQISKAEIIGVGPRIREDISFNRIIATPNFEFDPLHTVCTPRVRQNERFDINSLPFSNLDQNFYHVDPCNYDYILASRGCIFNCEYCLTSNLYSGIYMMEPCRFAYEILYRKVEYGITDFYISDMILDVQPERTETLCKYLQTSKISWCCEGRAEFVADRPNIIRQMKAAGCNRIKIGVEGGSDEQLKSIGKDRLSVNAGVGAIKVLKDAEITPVVYMMLGGIGMDRDDYVKQLDFMEGLGDDIEYVMNIVTPFYGTKFYTRLCKEYGLDEKERAYLSDAPQMSTFLQSFWKIDDDILERALGMLVSPKRKNEIESQSVRKYQDHPIVPLS